MGGGGYPSAVLLVKKDAHLLEPASPEALDGPPFPADTWKGGLEYLGITSISTLETSLSLSMTESYRLIFIKYFSTIISLFCAVFR